MSFLPVSKQDMIDRGIAQLSAGNGQEHELDETDWGCKLGWLAYNIDENGFLWIIVYRGHYEDSVEKVGTVNSSGVFIWWWNKDDFTCALVRIIGIDV